MGLINVLDITLIIGNIAQGRPTAQSTTCGGMSSRAVDGNTNVFYDSQSCTQTEKQDYAWWRVDVGTGYAISKLKITNRADCCGWWLRFFEVRIGDVEGMPEANTL